MNERIDPRSVVVVGGGILGCLTSLLLVDAGFDVTLIEQGGHLWNETSIAGEGKVHLGLVYAQGSAATRNGMLRAAIEFAPVVESAIGHAIDWTALTGDPFDYLVMPGSLLSADDLMAVYKTVDAEHAELGRPRYLGGTVDGLVEGRFHTDGTGVPAISTAERAVEPAALRSLVLAAIEQRSASLRVEAATRVTSIEQRERGAVVSAERVSSASSTSTSTSITLSGAAVVDARWAWQGHGVQGVSVGARNLRVKSSMVLDASASSRTITMVVGPFGDVVRRRDSVYASWYPVGRLAHEHRAFPSDALMAALASARGTASAAGQLAALAERGVIDGDAQIVSMHAGIIVGDGTLDIDSPLSGLHDRAGVDVPMVGRVALPRSLKFTTAPSAARRTVAAIVAAVGAPPRRS